VALRADLVRDLGGFREEFTGAHDHDLILRVGEIARRIVHIPRVLYHCRSVDGLDHASAAPEAVDAGVRAVQSHLDRVGVNARAERGPVPGVSVRLTYSSVPGQRVSVIVPTIGSAKLIWGQHRPLVLEAVRSVIDEAGDYDLEVVVVYDEPTPERVLNELRTIAGDRLKLVRFDEPFNYARKMNVGVLNSRGDRLVFLNDDVETKQPGWLAQLLGPLEQPDVGMTGAKLYFADSTLQHVGQVYADGSWEHVHVRELGDSPGPFATFVINREVSGVTGACVGMRRETFLDAGGFNEGFPNNYNDVDLCYKVRRAGYRIVWIAACELFHFESATRDNRVSGRERKMMAARWGRPRRDAFLPGA
jgi:GT2 family glycosyltransferase